LTKWFGCSADGKLFVNDRLLAVDGVRVSDLTEAARLMTECNSDMVELIVSDDSRTVVVARAAPREKIGVSLEHSPFPRPVKITEVQPGSYGERAGLVVGDRIVTLNGTRISDSNQCVQLIGQSPLKDLTMKIRSANPTEATQGASVVGRMVRSLSFSKRSRKPKGRDDAAAESPRGSTPRATPAAEQFAAPAPHVAANVPTGAGVPVPGLSIPGGQHL